MWRNGGDIKGHLLTFWMWFRQIKLETSALLRVTKCQMSCFQFFYCSLSFLHLTPPPFLRLCSLWLVKNGHCERLKARLVWWCKSAGWNKYRKLVSELWVGVWILIVWADSAVLNTHLCAVTIMIDLLSLVTYLYVCTVHQWRLKHFIIQQMNKYLIRRYN